MLLLIDIPSARAEKALYRANEVLSDFRLAWPTVRVGSLESFESARDAMLRLVTIAELFAGEHLVDLVEQRLPDNDMALRIWDERMPRIVGDWRGRKAGWAGLFDLKWDYKQWTELNGFITARNIIAHGMGELTKSQLQRGRVKESVTKILGQAKLTLRGHELVPAEADVERCGRRVKHFIEWLDTQSRALAPAL